MKDANASIAKVALFTIKRADLFSRRKPSERKISPAGGVIGLVRGRRRAQSQRTPRNFKISAIPASSAPPREKTPTRADD